jgi:hypothetical protein
MGYTPLPLRSFGIKDLGDGWHQNLGFKELRGKIFQNKELVAFRLAGVGLTAPVLGRGGVEGNPGYHRAV